MRSPLRREIIKNNSPVQSNTAAELLSIKEKIILKNYPYNCTGENGGAFFVVADDILNGDEGQDTLTGGVFTRLPNGQLTDSRDVSGVVILNAGDINNDNIDGDNAFDQIVLGGRNADGTPFIHYDQAGNNDYALINNFESGLDKIVVRGNISRYSFGPSPINQNADTNALFFNGELIAVIDNARGLANAGDLTGNII